MTEVGIGDSTLEVVTDFRYLGDMLSSGGGCELAAATHCKAAWKQFRELLPILTNKHLPTATRGHVYSSCVRSVLMYGSETWAVSANTKKKLQRNDKAMIRWICLVKPEQTIPFESLLAQINLKSHADIMQKSRLRWLGHVERSTGWIAQVRQLNVPVERTTGRPKLSWEDVVKRDRKTLGMDSVNPHHRQEWRGRLRLRLDSQAPPSTED
ncbi:uncharacterized protein LOC130051460 [Ostrea edulis]|uniref:uncharacterized protein LOC130051460 n=1 Tax=Ostrea edulis TaxID=37623 RepID=UPI0024AED835|nr:uncharacterized protein LOC130051460 [Ostrea edulis]